MDEITRKCGMCRKQRDADELFDGGSTTCLLCGRKAERTKEGMLHRSVRQRDHLQRIKLSPAEKYRRQLVSAGYGPEQIDRYVAARFPEESTA